MTTTTTFTQVLARGLHALCGVLLFTSGFGVLAADPPPQGAPTREQVERRMNAVATLIDQSSGAKQIERSGNADAQAQRAKARELQLAAQEALRAGDVGTASRKLDDAARAMVEGVRHAAPEQVTRSKERNDFDARLESTRALVDAQKRIAAEKGLASRDAELLRKIEALVAQARERVAADDVTGGRKLLDNAYLLAKASVSGMRSGDTLVRSLNFASKEEEYRYEIDRNDTHRMLVDVLLKDRARDGGVDDALRESARLRRNAEEQSVRRDFDAGVKSLEESTRSLQRAIRGAGIYIPG